MTGTGDFERSVSQAEQPFKVNVIAALPTSAHPGKLIKSAGARWHAVNAPHLVALVRAGARSEKGTLVERPEESEGDAHAA